jgi:hypothetical protein
MLSADMDGFYTVQWRIAGQSWQLIRQFPIYLRAPQISNT